MFSSLSSHSGAVAVSMGLNLKGMFADCAAGSTSTYMFLDACAGGSLLAMMNRSVLTRCLPGGRMTYWFWGLCLGFSVKIWTF